MAKGKKTGGRKAGVPNKVTADVRVSIALLAENNIDRVQGWLERGAKRNPLGAAKVFAQLLEYHVPKLSRAEQVGDGGGPLTIKVITGVPPPDRDD